MLKKLKSNKLYKNIQTLNQLNSKALQLLLRCDKNPPALKLMLDIVEILDPDLFKYLHSWLGPYILPNGDISINDTEFQKIEDYLRDLDDGLPSHADYARTLNKTLEDLILETEDYRNSLFAQAYP